MYWRSIWGYYRRMILTIVLRGCRNSGVCMYVMVAIDVGFEDKLEIYLETKHIVVPVCVVISRWKWKGIFFSFFLRIDTLRTGHKLYILMLPKYHRPVAAKYVKKFPPIIQDPCIYIPIVCIICAWTNVVPYLTMRMFQTDIGFTWGWARHSLLAFDNWSWRDYCWWNNVSIRIGREESPKKEAVSCCELSKEDGRVEGA